MAQLNIFISSTCYDLSQIRADLRNAIIKLGHNPIMSEDVNFPIDTNSSNVENCIKVVKEETDIFVLVIGSHYGAEIKNSGKSITNIEYLTAVRKGIPIYTFTLESMINAFAIWKDNPNVNFKSLGVDDNRVFDFINQVRVESGKWNFQFSTAQDIATTLTAQLSILFKNSLKKQRLIDNCDSSQLQSLVSAKAYKYLVEKPDDYEMKFMLQNMQEAIATYYELKNDYKYSILFKSDRQLDDLSSVISYCNLTFSRFSTLIFSLNNLINAAFKKSYGEFGTPSDIEGLYYVAKSYGKIYKSLLETAIEVRSVIVDERYKHLMDLLSSLPSMAIEQMESYPTETMLLIDTALSNRKSDDEHIEVTSTLKISIDDTVVNNLEMEMKRLSHLPI